jgi:acetate---CoA ligase (ADP-forming)
MRSDLERFFSPKSVALIGASQDLITISGQPLSHLVNHGYSGKLYPVNPRYAEILGHKCYQALADVPETPDLAIILINAARVADILEQCGKKGVPYVVIFSSGFSETGAEGVALQQRLTDIARQYNIGVIGPNCRASVRCFSPRNFPQAV